MVTHHDTTPIYHAVIDTETTGLDPEVHGITQIGCIVLDENLIELDSFNVHPIIEEGLEIGSFAMALTGLTYSGLLTRTKTEREALEDLAKFLDYFTTLSMGMEPVFAGFNCAFDLRMLNAAYERHGLPFPYRVDEKKGPTDLLKAARDNLKKPAQVINHKLVTVAEFFNYQEGDDLGAHNAIGDCRRTAHVWRSGVAAGWEFK